MVLQGVTILVVDDDPAICDALTATFEAEGAVVLVAFDGQQALDVMSQVIPSLALIDLMMPRMTGGQLAEQMHRDERLSKVAICIMTATNAQLPPPIEHILRKPLSA